MHKEFIIIKDDQFAFRDRFGLQSVIVAFLGHTLTFFETVIVVDDNTIVYIRLNYKAALA